MQSCTLSAAMSISCQKGVATPVAAAYWISSGVRYHDPIRQPNPEYCIHSQSAPCRRTSLTTQETPRMAHRSLNLARVKRCYTSGARMLGRHRCWHCLLVQAPHQIRVSAIAESWPFQLAWLKLPSQQPRDWQRQVPVTAVTALQRCCVLFPPPRHMSLAPLCAVVGNPINRMSRVATQSTNPVSGEGSWINFLAVSSNQSISGLVVKSIVAIDGPRVRFTADANILIFATFGFLLPCPPVCRAKHHSTQEAKALFQTQIPFFFWSKREGAS
jgi:hypothetical protein